MLQMRQQAPASPMGQGFILSARLNAVSMPQPSACASISRAAGSMLLARTSRRRRRPSSRRPSSGSFGQTGTAADRLARRAARGRAVVPRGAAVAASPPRVAAVDRVYVTGSGHRQYLRWSPDMDRSAGSVVVTLRPAAQPVAAAAASRAADVAAARLDRAVAALVETRGDARGVGLLWVEAKSDDAVERARGNITDPLLPPQEVKHSQDVVVGPESWDRE